MDNRDTVKEIKKFAVRIRMETVKMIVKLFVFGDGLSCHYL